MGLKKRLGAASKPPIIRSIGTNIRGNIMKLHVPCLETSAANRLLALVALATTSCASHPVAATLATTSDVAQEVVYVSTNLDHVAIFTPESARFGDNPLAFSDIVWPSSPARYFESGDGIQCVSVGPPNYATEFAIKRPITEGERYQCLTTVFRVTKCFRDCRGAIVERVARLGAGTPGTLTTYMFVDHCLGVVILSLRPNADLAGGIPLDAEWLRGNVGILAHRNYPDCTPF